MSCLIDTNICIFHIKRELSFYEERDHRDGLAALHLSQITVADLFVGAFYSE